MRAEDIASLLGGILIGNAEATIEGVSIDSRKISGGELFFALKGERHDGHSFVMDALSKGAVGAVVERLLPVPEGKFIVVVGSVLEALRRLARWKRENFKGRVIGVAGSVGKTTTKELIYHLLSKVSKAYRSEGNLNSQIGLPLVLANMPQEADYTVLELGASRVGDVLSLTKLSEPSVRVITAIGEEHLQTFRSLENVIKGNGEIFYGFDEESWAVLPSNIKAYYDLPPDRLITFGEGSELRASGVRLSLKGTEFRIGDEAFSIPVLSRGVVENVLASFGVLKALGHEPEEFREALMSFRAPEGRMNLIDRGDFFLIDDTYNANPPSVKNAVRTLCSLETSSKRVAVLGDMLELGEESPRLHAEIGKFVAQQGVDCALFYGREMEEAYKECKRYGGVCFFFREKESLKEEMLKWMKDKNIILLKGSRGMRMEELYRDEKR